MKKQVMFMIFMILMIGAIIIIILNKGELTTTSDLETAIQIPQDYATIQEGINASKDGDVIIVSPGTYIENINFAGKAVILGSLYYTTQDTSYISQTIIDGNQDGTVVTFDSKEDSTSVLSGLTITYGHAFLGGGIECYSSSPILDNVTITGNSASNGGGIFCSSSSNPSLENVTITDNSASFGGGIYCFDESSPSLENVTITGNSAGSAGGGIYCVDESSPSLENVTIMGNSAGSAGGGICCSHSNLSLENVTIKDNSAEELGGGICCFDESSPSLVNVTIMGNSAGSAGGGICCSHSNLSLENVTIKDNSAEELGGGICCYDSSPSLANVTITDNSAGDAGGGIFCHSSSPSLVNCIFWYNLPQEVGFSSHSDPYTITIAYSDIDGGEEGIVPNNSGTVNWLEGNIDADPLFVDAELGDYHLTEDSPCVDTGIAYFEFSDKVIVDLSEDEYFGAAPDMGAYEYGLKETDELKN